MQNLSLVQNNLRQDLDRLRTVNLYEGCIQETRTCTLPIPINPYWIGCQTGDITINPGVSVFIIIIYLHTLRVVSIPHACRTQSTSHPVYYGDLSNTGFFVSTSYYKSGNNIIFAVTVSRRSWSWLSSLGKYCRLHTDYHKCPYTQNLLN